MKQRTIKNQISFENIGIHSGEKVKMTLYPSEANTGILFRRRDTDSDWIKLSYEKVLQTVLCTGIVDKNTTIKTIEHFVAGLAMLGIDNIRVEVNSEEIPIMDGSAMPFIFLLKEAGIQDLYKNKKFIKIKKELSYEEDGKYVSIKPSKEFKINYQIDFDHPLIKKTNNKLSVNVLNDDLSDLISKARTFGFLKDVEYLKENNLAKGGSLDNAVILDDFKVLNPDGLRYEDEFLRHKILDMIGDLYVDGMFFLGEFTAYKSGHYMNNMALRTIFASPENYEIVEFKNSKEPITIIEPENLSNPLFLNKVNN